MTQETILANAKLILGDEVVTGSLRMGDGMLAEMGTGTSVPKDAVDCDGDYLAPGLIELHTDNLDRHMLPHVTASKSGVAARARSTFVVGTTVGRSVG